MHKMFTILVRVLAAAELQGDLHVVGVEVVEVLHPPVQGVPVCPVSDAVIEKPPAMELSGQQPHVLSSPGAHALVQHGQVTGSVARGQVFKERVVRSGGDARVHWFTLGH